MLLAWSIDFSDFLLSHSRNRRTIETGVKRRVDLSVPELLELMNGNQLLLFKYTLIILQEVDLS